MNHNRNVEGLRHNAQKKRLQAIERTDQAIKQLIKEGKSINFKVVAELSGVSTAWLYKEPDIKERIETLRAQSNQKELPPVHRATDESRNAVIATLKDRIKKLDQENRELRKQNEVFGGYVLKARELEQQVQQLLQERAKPEVGHNIHS